MDTKGTGVLTPSLLASLSSQGSFMCHKRNTTSNGYMCSWQLSAGSHPLLNLDSLFCHVVSQVAFRCMAATQEPFSLNGYLFFKFNLPIAASTCVFEPFRTVEVLRQISIFRILSCKKLRASLGYLLYLS